MLVLILAQAAAPVLGHWIIMAIVIAAIVAIGLVFLRVSGVGVPSWFPQILWIVLAAMVAIVAIRFLLSAAG